MRTKIATVKVPSSDSVGAINVAIESAFGVALLVGVASAFGLALLVGVALSGFARMAQAADPEQRSPVGSPSDNPKKKLDLGPVRSARSLLNAVVQKPGGGEFGRIKDVGLDIGQGTVAAIHVMPTTPIDGKPISQSFPMARLRWTSNGTDIVLDTQPDAPPALSSPGDPDTESRVVLLTKLGDVPIHNARGDKLGSITDFGLARQKGLITYAIMVLEEEAGPADTLYPIPLAAFVVQRDSTQWILELPEGTLENTPTIKKDQWPTTVPSAWIEYVSVRYGRSPFGGVQLKLRENK